MKKMFTKITFTLVLLTALWQQGISQVMISTTDETTICVDGIPDPINVTVTNAPFDMEAWIITDPSNEILGTPPGGPFDLDGAGSGVCSIWNISHDGTLTGNTVGNNITDLMGTFELSNAIVVTRNEPMGGTLVGGPFEFCVGDGNADNVPAGDVTVSGNNGETSQWVVTDTQRNILGLPPTPEAVNFDGAGGDICQIFNLSFFGDLVGLEVGMNLDDVTGCLSESDNFITVVRNEVAGGTITTTDETTICIDGTPDPINVTLTGEIGTNSNWVITDTDLNILGLPAAPPFDLDGAGAGTCLIWHLSSEDGLMGAAVGMNAADLVGCFDLSDSIVVIRNESIGGTITTTDETTICVDGTPDPIDVTLMGEAGQNSAWVITDADLNILGLPAAPPFDLDGAGGGTCLIWHLSFADGLTGAEVGMNAGDLEGCFALSNSITVVRNEPDGGSITTTDETTICIDGTPDPINVTLTGEIGTNSNWVITDTDLNILGLPAAPPFDLDGAGTGTCLIWHLSSEDGLMGAAVGMNAADLVGCFDLSDSIVVIRNESIGGTITTTDETTICIDGTPNPINVTLMGEAGQNSAWVITDADLNILGLPAAPPFDLDGAGGGTCLIWHLSFADGLTGAEVGMNAGDLEGCFELSNSITVVRNEPDGGSLMTEDSTTICIDGIGDPIDVEVEGAVGADMQWIITDDTLKILAKPAGPPFDLDGAGPGTCLIWHVSSFGIIMGDTINGELEKMIGCFDLSDSIAVVRNQTASGTLSGGPYEFCVGDGNADNIPMGEVTVSDNVGENSQWVVTDAQRNILGLPPTPEAVDFDGAGGGTCRVYHLSFFEELTGLTIGNSLDDVVGCLSESDNFISVVRTEVNGGEISTMDETTICIDGVGDPIDVTLTGEIGTNSNWVITDTNLNILGLPAAPPFDLDGAGAGTCLIWHLSSEDGLTGAEVGMNAGDLEGCFDLSNSITVLRNESIGGTITANDATTICVDGNPDPIDVTLAGEAGQNSAWVITDTELNILGLPSGPPFDLDGAGTGVCLIWHLSFSDGLVGAEVGQNAADLEGCFELSNSIEVTRDAVDGGSVAFANGDDIYANCPGQVVFDVSHETTNEYFEYFYIITSVDNMILGVVDASTANTLDLSEAPLGECHVWGWNSIGTTTPTIGENISSLEGQNCEELSENFLIVLRQNPDGGEIALLGGGTEYEGCAGDLEFDLTFETSAFLDYWFVVTDDNSNILTWFNSDNGGWIDINGAPPGVCRIYGWSEKDQPEPVAGAHITSLNSSCGSISENRVTVTRLDCEAEDCEVQPASIYTSAEKIENRVVVANRGSGTVSIIDADSDQVIATHDMPNEGEPMYVVYNNLNNTYLVGDYFGYVAAFNANDFSHTGSVEAGDGVFHMWISPDNSQLWVNNELDRTISVINPTTLENIATVDLPTDLYDLGYKPHDVILMPNNEAAFVTLLGSEEEDYVIKYSTSTFEETGRVAVGKDPHVVLTPSNDKLYVAAQGASLLYVFNRSDLSLVTQVDVPNAHGLGVNASGTYVYIGNISEGGSNATYTLDLNTNELVGEPVDAPFPVPHNYAASGDEKLYLTHSGGANFQVSVYDLTPSPVLNTSINVQSNPFGLAAFSINNTTDVSICVDGEADPIDVTVEGGSGMNNAWVITDTEGNILGLPPTGPFDLDGAGEGTCLIWYLTYDDVSGAEVGMNANALEGCFALSNPITVTREAADGGTVSLADGSDASTFCAGDVVFDLQHTTTAPNLNYWYVITDNNDNILGFHNTADGSTLDLSGAPAGECHIWGWSYSGEANPVMGDNISSLTDGSCEAISENFITITRITPEAATISTLDETSICVDGIGDPINVEVDGGSGSNNAWVITNTSGEILGLPASGPFDLDGAGEGTCLIWYLTYENVSGAEVGMNANDLEGCFALSNPITVTRETANGGMVSLTDGATEGTFTVGDVIFDVQHTTTAPNLNYYYIITDNNDSILGFHNTADGPTLDLSGAPAGQCHIWGWSNNGESDPVIGENISTLTDGDCEVISDNFITITREEPGAVLAATISTMDDTTICVDGIADPINITVEGGTGDSTAYVITDVDGTILGLPAMGPFDLDGAGEGICLIWHLSYNFVDGAEVGMNANDLTGEFALSNPITVTRQSANGGVVALTNGLDTATYCVGSAIFDVDHTTTATALSYWYIITDNNDNILGFHNTADGPTLDLSGAPAGECHIWGWSYKGEPNPIMGENISTLSDGDCEAVSDNFITIVRAEGINGGTISTEDSVIACPGDGDDDIVNFVTTGSGDSYVYILTDENDVITGTAIAASSFNFEGSEPGVARVYGVAYAGSLVVGNTIQEVEGNEGSCAIVSDNFIEIIIQETADCFSTSTIDETIGSITVYPNPAIDFITLDYTGLSNDAIVSIIDAQGKRVSTQFLADTNGQVRIDMNNLTRGLYLVQVSSNEELITKRIVLMK